MIPTKRSKKKAVGKPTKPKNSQTPLQKFLQTTDVLKMIYPKDQKGRFYRSSEITREDERIVYDLITNKKKFNSSLLVFIDSPGGNVYAAVKIMDTLRTKYKDISIAVAEQAKSSATMMCLGADEIVMSSISELGPLDKPMLHPDDETTQISALDVVRALDGTINSAIDKQQKLATDLIKNFGLSKKHAVEIAGGSIAELFSPLLSKEDSITYNEARRLLSIAELYGKEFLQEYMLQYITDKDVKKRIAEYVMERLIWRYPDHGYAIRRDELRDWFFSVKNAEDCKWWPELWKEFDQSIGKEDPPIIKFL